MHIQNFNVQFDTGTKELMDTFTALREVLSRCNITDAYRLRIFVQAEANPLMVASPPASLPAPDLVEPMAKKDSVADDPYRDQLEAVTRDELSSLLNQYAGKHPGKTKAARDVLGQFGGTRLSDVATEDWPKIAATLRAYIEAH